MKKRIFSGIGIAGIIMLAVAAICVYFAVTYKNPAAGMLALVLIYFGADSTWFEINYAWTNGGLKDKYELWKKKRYWTRQKQLEHLIRLLHSDKHWLSHDKTANELINRYRSALREDWYTISFPDSSNLRDELQLNPMFDKPKIGIVIYRMAPGETTQIVAGMILPPRKVFRDATHLAEGTFISFREKCCRKDESLRSHTWAYEIVDIKELSA